MLTAKPPMIGVAEVELDVIEHQRDEVERVLNTVLRNNGETLVFAHEVEEDDRNVDASDQMKVQRGEQPRP